MIPIKYNLRNLRARRFGTATAVLTSALVVWASCLSFGLADGLRHGLRVAGDPLDLIVLRKGGTNEINGGFYSEIAEDLRLLDGIARDGEGRPLAALELASTPLVPRGDESRATIIVRGIDPASPALRSGFALISGRMPEPGRGECIVGRGASGRFVGTRQDESFVVDEGERYRVVGAFSCGGGPAESEVWADRRDLERNIGREGSVSCVQLRAESPEARERLRESIEGDTRFKLTAIREADYYAGQARAAGFLTFSGAMIAGLLTLGALFATANTMSGIVEARTREIGTMRALGFSRAAILCSFLAESLLLCGLGGILGLLATIPMGSLGFGTVNSETLSEMTISFRFGPPVMASAFAITLITGIAGGLLPALRAVRLDVIQALRRA